MEAGNGVRPVFRKDQGLPQLLPPVQLHPQGVPGRLQVPGQVIPAVVPVDHHHVHGRDNPVPFIPVLAAHQRHRPPLGILPVGQLIQGVPVVVSLVRIGLRVRLIPQAPHHHAGVVLVPGDHVLQHFLVVCLQVPSVVLVRPHAHRRGLVHDHDPLPVAQPVHFLRVGVMAGSEAVGVQPAVQVDVRHVQGLVHAPAVEGAVLVLAGAVEPEGLPVDQEPGALHPHLPDAEGLLINVLPEGEPGGIQVRGSRPGLPQPGLRDPGASLAALSRGHGLFLRVQEFNPHFLAFPAAGFRAPAHRAVRPGHNRHVPDIGFRGGDQAHRPLQPRVVEKVKGRLVDALLQLPLFPGLHRRDPRVVGAQEGGSVLRADGQGAVVDPVVRLHRQPGALPGLQDAPQLHLKGQESAPVAGDLLSVQQNPGAVGRAVKAQANPHSLPQGGNRDLPAVFRLPHVPAEPGIRALVVVGRRHGNPLPFPVPLQPEIPDASQVHQGPGGVVLRIKCFHAQSSVFQFHRSGSFPQSFIRLSVRK